MGYKDGPNLYTYCFNNPVNYVDPYGLGASGAGGDTPWWLIAGGMSLASPWPGDEALVWGAIGTGAAIWGTYEAGKAIINWASNREPHNSFDRSKAQRKVDKTNRNLDPKPGKDVPPVIDLENFKTKIGRGLDVAADILSKIFGIK